MGKLFGEVALVEDVQQQELDRIATKILALAEARKGQRQPYLVSALGIDLGDDLRTLKLITGKGLNEFIQDRLSSAVTLIRLGAHRNVTAIIDGSANTVSFEEPRSDEGKQKRRFHFRFWAAFSVPAAGETRVLNSADLTFCDVALADVPEGALTISNELIAPVDAENRDDLIKANIARWLNEQNLPEEKFFAPKRLPSPRVIGSAPTSISLLEALIAALDRKQQQSTVLSLDVVATLLRTPRN